MKLFFTPMKQTFLFLISLFLTTAASAQTPVPAPQKDGEYKLEERGRTIISGMCKDGHKTGTWTYNNSYGKLQREERYDENGFLLSHMKQGSGGIWEEVSVKNDVPHGRYRASYSPITKEYAMCFITGWYTDGKKDSTWTHFRMWTTGYNLWKTETWKEDIRTEIRTYYISGKLFDIRTLNKYGKATSITYYSEAGTEMGKVLNPVDLPLSNNLPPPPPPPASTNDPEKTSAVKKDTVTTSNDSQELFVFAEEMPEFPGGGMMTFLVKNIRYPEYAKDAGIQGTVFISFVVNKYGGVERITVMNKKGGAHSALEKEAVRVMEMMPPWTPGRISGRPVNVQYTQPIKFVLQ
jgi:TonB family protein